MHGAEKRSAARLIYTFAVKSWTMYHCSRRKEQMYIYRVTNTTGREEK